MTLTADTMVTLPTRRLVATSVLTAVITGGLWSIACFALGLGGTDALTGLAAGGVVAAAAAFALLAIRPWRPKPLATWPMIWVAGKFVRMVLTFAGAFLLYSATPYRGWSLWIAVGLAYLAVMIGESRMYVSSMRSIGAPASREADPSASER